ncbi:hypothetical protein A8B78_20390 [Jannaschia sp. EhC01]|nr:hypothetical protein A8B78_20390 [Jannaschia sp. EhC01]
MPVDPITSDIVIQVSNAQELQDAYATLSNSVGGGRIELLGDAEGMGLLLRGGGSEPVHITSADTSDPVALSFISLNDVDNVRISDVDVDNTGVDFPSGSGGFGIADSEAIELSNVTFTGPATSFFDPSDPDAVPTVSLGSVRGSDDILISDIHGSGYKHGLTITETSEITFTNNTFTELQGDGLRMGGVQDVTISDNHFHDFLGSTNGYNHDDMIQVWSTNTTMVNGDITITGNILDRGDGNTTQAIFFRNERYEVTRDPDHIYENITISDNLIYNSHYHGITVAHADNVTVTDNTLLWNTSSGVAPRINLGGATNVTATGNVTPHLGLPEGAEADGNLVLDYADTLSENFVGNHIVNPLTPGGVELSELRLRPDSDYVGTGSPFSDPVLTTEEGVEAVVTITADLEDPQTLLLDAGFSIDENGFLNEEDYTFTWHLPNGSTQEGATIAYRLDTPGNAEVGLTITHGGEVVAEEEYGLFVEDATYFSLNAETGFDDQSSYDSEVFNSGAELVDTNNGAAFHIGGSDYFGLSLNNDQIHGLPGFNLSMEMQVLNSSQGDFVRMGSTMQGSIQWDGTLTYVLRTDEGAFNLNSGDVKVDDGLLHDITIHYSNEDGVLELHIDGDVVDSVAASGITSPNPENSLFIGSPWNPTVEALISEVSLTAVPHEEALTPEEPPVVKDPMVKDYPIMEVCQLEKGAVSSIEVQVQSSVQLSAPNESGVGGLLPDEAAAFIAALVSEPPAFQFQDMDVVALNVVSKQIEWLGQEHETSSVRSPLIPTAQMASDDNWSLDDVVYPEIDPWA